VTEARDRTADNANPGPEPWIAPASYAQERVWFASQLAPEASVYHVVDQFDLPYPVREQDVVTALAVLAERHETLRTSLSVQDGELIQAVHRDLVPPVTHLDLSHLAAPEQQERVGDTFDSLARTAIPLDRAPLWRVTLVKLGPAGWVLLVVAHHAVFDAASALNLRAELTELCAAAAQGRPARLPELAVQYADYAVWQRDQLGPDRMAELLGFWRRELTGLPVVHGLPTDLPRPAERSFAGAETIFALPQGAEAAAAGLARQASATPFMVMFAAYAALLHRLSGSQDIVIGLPVAGRDRPELQPLIGMFVNMVVVRVNAAGNPVFTELLDRARQALLAAWDHQDMPFQKLVEMFPQHRDVGLAPLYQLGFNYLSIGFSRSAAAAEDDLMLEICQRRGRLEYNTALFTEQTAGRIADAYQRVLGAVLAYPGVRMSELPVTVLPVTVLPVTVLPVTAPPVTGPPGHPPPGHPPAGDPPAAGRPRIAPRTAAEELVARVWSEVLGTDEIGALDDFFDLGGHSLLALRAIARLSAATGTELSIQSFFADTSLAGVAAELERLLTAELAEMSDDEAARLVAGPE
jgi:hypothetical protein